MIIGAILETSYGSSGVQTNDLNGAAMVTFNVWQDAVAWARTQSRYIDYGTDKRIRCVCSVINTSTQERVVYFDGNQVE